MASIITISRIWYLARFVPLWLPGRTRLTRAIFRALAGNKSNSSLYKIRAGGLSYFAPSLDEPVAASLILDGFYEPGLRRVLSRSLAAGGVFIDIGANIGCHSFYASTIVGHKGRVISIEASPSIFRLLGAGITENGFENIQALNVIAGEIDYQSSFFFDAPKSKFGMGSRSSQRFGEANKASVPMITIDTISKNLELQSIDFIKIDVEGFERQVLEGCIGVLQRHHPVISFEFCDWSEDRPRDGIKPGDAQRLLMSMGYRIYPICSYRVSPDPLVYPLTSGSSDLLAIWDPMYRV